MYFVCISSGFIFGYGFKSNYNSVIMMEVLRFTGKLFSVQVFTLYFLPATPIFPGVKWFKYSAVTSELFTC